MALLLAGLVLALAPATALAQGSGSAYLVLYEVMESPPPRPSTGGRPGAFVPGPDGSVTRLAQATLAGPVVAAAGSLADWLDGEVQAHAQSRVSLATRQGPLNGAFTVDTMGLNGAIPGKLSGILDLSMLLSPTSPVPLAPTWGSWRTLGQPSSRLGGTFSGVAQVPVDCGMLPGDNPAGMACYLNPSTGLGEQLAPDEFKDGVPLVRFVIELTAD